jgi:hypothetical protein
MRSLAFSLERNRDAFLKACRSLSKKATKGAHQTEHPEKRGVKRALAALASLLKARPFKPHTRLFIARDVP